MEHLDEYIRWKSSSASIYSIRDYRSILNRVKMFLHGRELNINTWLDYREGMQSRGLSEGTIMLHSSAVRGYLSFCKLRDYESMNPLLIKTKKHHANSWVPTTEADMKSMLKVIPYANHFQALRAELMLHFLFSTGVRVSELCDLKIDGVNLTKKEAIIQTKKTTDVRTVMWDDITNELLVKYFDYHQEIGKCGNVFINTRGHRLSTRSVERIVKDIRQRAGIKHHIVPHSFRHSFITHGAEHGVNMAVLQKLAGHRSLTSTQCYVHVSNPVFRKIYSHIWKKRLA